jgi:putative transposase
MTIVPRYAFPPGTEITLLERPMVVTGQDDQGYRVADLNAGGVTTVLPFMRLVEQVKLSGARIDTDLPMTGGRLAQRLGGYATAQALPEEQREMAQVHLALCRAMEVYRDRLRAEHGDPSLDLSDRLVDRPEARRFIAEVASAICGRKIRVEPARGGNSRTLQIYRGRTLMKYFRIFESLEPGESPLDALVTLDHQRGNRTARLCDRHRELMTEAWEKIGLDLKKPSVSNVLGYLEARVFEENERRVRNELPKLVVPSHRTLREHRDRLLTPSEIMVATHGLRHARNKRGRGSTDYRALMIGEVVEIDECRISLVASAKEEGFWERLPVEWKEALENADEYVRSRWCILAMIDVASRMPLAWVISEQPNAEATLALFRMATRDKAREKALYGCSGEPAAPVGLLHVKNDNGSGLRNGTCIKALMGIGSINTVTRTFAPTDRSVGERPFGTLEMKVFKLLPGYTGRCAGELPGYDALENGVLDIEELHAIVSRYFIDEYPSTRHYGFGMNGRRPYEVYEAINATRGQIPPIDPHRRRINLGWEEEVTPTDEGVRVFGGIWFNSTELQVRREALRVTGKVKVFVDPDDMNFATVILPMGEQPIEVQLQVTAFADMTLPEVLKLMAEQRRENPDVAEFHHERVMRTRLQRHAKITAIGVEHGLSRSYSTVEECRAMARAVFSGARVLPPQAPVGTTPPGEITRLQASGEIYAIGNDAMLIDGTAEAIEADAAPDVADRVPVHMDPPASPVAPKAGRRRTVAPTETPPRATRTFSLPKNLKELE